MSKLDAIQAYLTNDLRIFKEPFFEGMEEVQVISHTEEPTWKEPLFHVRSLDYFESWHVCGIVGGRRPSTYSESPWLWNTYFKKLGIQAVLFGFDLPVEKNFMDFFQTALDTPDMLDLTVTDPYKSDAFKALENCEFPVEWSDQAKDTKAVNHVIVDASRVKLTALNTDGIGMARAVREKEDIQGKKVLIIGAGGSAVSIGYEFVRAGCDLSIVNRTPSRAESLSELLSQYQSTSRRIDWGGFDRLPSFLKDADVVINTVAEGCPLDSENIRALKGHAVLAEAKYGPKAELKDMASEGGLEYIDGRNMLFGQFAEAAAFVYPLFGIAAGRHEQVMDDMKKEYLNP